jgi:hypothetical protein
MSSPLHIKYYKGSTTFVVMLRCICLLLLLVPGYLNAQGTNIRHKIAPYFLYDSYYSFIGNRGADVWGFKAGIEWNQKWRLAAGYNRIQSDIIENKVLPQDELQYAKNDTVKAQLYLRYFPLMAEYVFYTKDPWQLSAPLCLGYGKSYFQYFDKNEDRRQIFKHGVLVSDIGINAQYKIIKWVGVGAGVGYRIMLVNNPEIDTKFNSPIFSIRVKLFLGEIVKSLFPESKLSK